MRIAYFVNKYPAVSHSFIRREVLELERTGIDVRRYAIYCEADTLKDPQDKQEHLRTRYIKAQPPQRLAATILGLALGRPRRFLRTFGEAVRHGKRADVGIIKHVFYFLEGCVLARWCERDGVSHVHAHFGTNSAAIAMYASRLSDVGYSFTVHGPDEFDNPRGLLLREKIRHARFVVAITSYCRSQLMRWSDHDCWPKIRIVHCGLDDAFFAPATKTDDVTDISKPYLLCIGRLSAQKGQLLLIEAIDKLRRQDRNIRLVLAGDGEMREEIEAYCRKHDLTEQVTITGWIDSQTVKQWLEGCLAMILPSFAEGLPVVIMEAFARRKPVLTTYIAGIPELVKDHENGLLFPAGSVNAIVSAINEIRACSPAVREQMGQAGYEAVKAGHHIRTEMEKMKRNLEHALAD